MKTWTTGTGKKILLKDMPNRVLAHTLKMIFESGQRACRNKQTLRMVILSLQHADIQREIYRRALMN